MDPSHATARPSRRTPCWLEAASSAQPPWFSCAFSVPSSEGDMGPGNSAECAGECVTRCKVSSSMERRETRTESRGRRIRGCGMGVCVLERADLCDRSSPGRVLRWSSGRPCIRTKRVSLGTRGVKYSGMRSHGRAACEASLSSLGAHDSGSLSLSSSSGCMAACEAQGHSSMPHSESSESALTEAGSRRSERTRSHWQSCVTSMLLLRMDRELPFMLSSCGIGVDCPESAGRAMHAPKWGTSGARGRESA